MDTREFEHTPSVDADAQADESSAPEFKPGIVKLKRPTGVRAGLPPVKVVVLGIGIEF